MPYLSATEFFCRKNLQFGVSFSFSIDSPTITFRTTALQASNHAGLPSQIACWVQSIVKASF